jgi:hypothetical protein
MQQLLKKKILYFKSIKFKERNKRNKRYNFKFNSEALISNMKEFFKFQGSSPYPQKLSINLFGQKCQCSYNNSILLKDDRYDQNYKYPITKQPFSAQKRTMIIFDNNAHPQY